MPRRNVGATISASPDARALAVDALYAVERGAVAQAALSATLARLDARRDVDPAHVARVKARCTELVYGVLRADMRLCHIRDRFLPHPGSLPLQMRLCLLLALYELYFLDAVPDHAAVCWAVDFARARFGTRLGRVVNAVLRNAQRLGDAPLAPDFYASGDALAAWALYHAQPLWLASLWEQHYGREAALALLWRSFAPPYACMRLNVRHPDALRLDEALCTFGGMRLCVGAPVPAEPLPVGRFPFQAFAFPPGGAPDALCGQALCQWHDLGVFSWQAAGSLIALAAAELGGGASSPALWDACAGQGGKALALAELGAPLVVCSDIHAGRLRQLQRTARRLGLPVTGGAGIRVLRASAERPPLAAWDGDILLDVPCSGLGTLARRPDIKRRRSMADIAALARTQFALVRAVWPLLRPGRALVYMTCTLTPDENMLQVQRVVREFQDARLAVEWQTPHTHPWLEGMYVARLEKR